MKALIVGLGSIGTRHLNNLHLLGVESLSAFRSKKRPAPVEILDKNTRIFEDYNKALEDNPDIVIIANPTSYHVPFATKALEANCHVYLEKPVSNSLENTDKLVKLAAEKKLIVMIGCQLRFHPHMEKIKQMLDEKMVGKVFSVHVDMGEYLPSWHPWEDYRVSYAARSDMGGGVILSQIHDIDYLYWLFGPVKDVYAMGGHRTPLEIDVNDTALISLFTEQEIPIQIRMDYWRNPPTRKMHIVGEKGEIFWDYHGKGLTLTQNGTVLKQFNLANDWDRNDLYKNIMKNFIDAVTKNDKIRVPLADGVEVLKIALAARESCSINKVVQI